MPTNRETKRAVKKAVDSKKPVKKTTANGRATPKKPAPTVSSAAQWKKSVNEGFDLAVPSGQTCRAKRPGLKVFIKEGLVPNNLKPLIEGAMNEGEAPKNNAEVAKAMEGTDLEEIMDLVDQVTLYCVLEPEIEPVPVYDEGDTDDPELIGTEVPQGSRGDDENERIFVDEVDFGDKMFLFNWAVGGTADVEQFREEQKEMLGAFS